MNELSAPPLTGLAAAVRALDKKGTKAQLGRLIGVSPMAMNNWKNDIPVGRLASVHRVTRVPINILKPDLRATLIKKMGVPPEILREQRGKRKRKPKVVPPAEPSVE